MFICTEKTLATLPLTQINFNGNRFISEGQCDVRAIATSDFEYFKSKIRNTFLQTLMK
jgi:hypothetical protein